MRTRFMALLAVLALLQATPARAEHEPERLRIHGSHTVAEKLVPALVEDWLQAMEYTGIRRVSRGPGLLEIHARREDLPLVVEIGGAGGGAGFNRLVKGDAELAMLARRPSAEERAAGWQLGDLSSPDQEYLLALNAARVVVHRDSPLQHIDLARLRAALTGGSTQRVLLGPADGGLEGFLRQRLNGGRALQPAGGLRHGNLRAVAAAVARDPSAIGVVELGTPLPAEVRVLPVSDGGLAVAADTTGIRSQDYPLAWRYSLYGGQMMSALGRSFALHTLGTRAQAVARRQGLVSMGLQVPAAAVAAPDAVPEAYRDAIAGGTRLPLALRFNLHSLTTIFDSSSAHDLERVAELLRRPEYRGRAVSVVAFSQAERQNRLFATTASSNRADIVAAWLAGHGIAVQRIRGLGALQPLAGGEGDEPRFRNERVELWLL